MEFNAWSLFRELHKHLDNKGARNLNDRALNETGITQEYLLTDKRLQHLELLKLDGPVEIEFTSVDDEDLFFALPLDHIPSLVTWRPDGLGWMNVPPRPTDKRDMVMLSNEWWVELRRSFNNAIQSIVQYQLFETGFLRLLIVPVPSEDVMRALVLTNLTVVLSHLDSETAVSKAGAKLLSHCMIFPSSGEFPATLDDIAYGCDERHSVNPPDQYFCMPPAGLSHKIALLPHKQTACAKPLMTSSNKPTFAGDFSGETAKHLAKQPLPVLLRQTSNPSESEQSSYLFPHQKRTIGWMLDVESGMTPPLFCPLANLFGSYYVFSYGMERALLHNRVEVLRPKDGCLANGGMIAHPVGSGKTIIAIELVSQTCSLGKTVICVPDHIVLQWYQELHRFAPNVFTWAFTRGGQTVPSSTDCLIVVMEMWL